MLKVYSHINNIAGYGYNVHERFGDSSLVDLLFVAGFFNLTAMTSDLAIRLYKSAKRDVMLRNPHIRYYEIEKATEDILEKRFGTEMMLDIMDHVFEMDFPAGISNKR